MNMQKGAIAAMAIMAGLQGIPVMALAEPTTPGSGVSADIQKYDSSLGQRSGHWSGDTDIHDGRIHLSYSTLGGSWQDPGQDSIIDTDNHAHDNGTYLVTIPTKIHYQNMNIGKVDTSDDYTVNVRGAIPDGAYVSLTAETDKVLSNGDDSGITEITTQGKVSWSDSDTFGGLNDDGSLKGTDCTDNIRMTGEAKYAGQYEGAVKYTAMLADLSYLDLSEGGILKNVASYAAKHGDMVTLPTADTLKRFGYVLDGFSTMPGVTTAEYQPGTEYTIKDGETLHPVWSERQVTVDMDAANSSWLNTDYSVVTVPQKKTISYFEPLNLKATLTGCTQVSLWDPSFADEYPDFDDMSFADIVRHVFEIQGEYADVYDEDYKEFTDINDVDASTATFQIVWENKDYIVAEHAETDTGEDEYNCNLSGYNWGMDTPLHNVVLPRKWGYDFVGIYTEPEGKGIRLDDNKDRVLGQIAMLIDGVTDPALVDDSEGRVFDLYWYYTKKTYSVIYDANGGTIDGQPTYSTTCSYNDKLNTSRFVPVRDGYTFAGWWNDLTEGVEVTNDTLYCSTVANDSVMSVTLYARWTKN